MGLLDKFTATKRLSNDSTMVSCTAAGRQKVENSDGREADRKYQVMQCVLRNQPMSIKDIADYCMLDTKTVRSILEPMAQCRPPLMLIGGARK